MNMQWYTLIDYFSWQRERERERERVYLAITTTHSYSTIAQ